MLLNVRGGSGAGKSYIGQELLRRYGGTPIMGHTKKGNERLVGQLLPGGLALLGQYRTDKTMGGIEGIYKTQNERQEAILAAADLYEYVYYESLFWSSGVTRGIEITALLAPRPHVTGFLTTPPEVCIEQVYRRNGGKPIKENIIRETYRRIQTVRRGYIAQGQEIVDIDHTRSVEQVDSLFRQYGWQPGHNPSLIIKSVGV